MKQRTLGDFERDNHVLGCPAHVGIDLHRCTWSTTIEFTGCAGERSARERRKYLSHKVNNAV